MQTEEWHQIANSSSFKELIAAKRRFIIPATVFFITYYFALPVLTGYFPELMKREIFGRVNLAYAFALSQFIMAWVLAWAYMRAAARFDRLAERTLQQSGKAER